MEADGVAAARGVPLRLVLVAGAAFAAGWSGVAAVRGAPAAFALYLEANEQARLDMTDEAGPVTYLVETRDAPALTLAVRAEESVLGLEPFRSSSGHAIAFTGADAPGIERVASLPGTLTMRRRRTPMICH